MGVTFGSIFATSIPRQSFKRIDDDDIQAPSSIYIEIGN